MTGVLGSFLARPPRYGIGAAAVPYQSSLPTYVRITDIDGSGRFSPNPRVSVDSPLSDNYQLTSGDLVVARTGASVGKSYRYRVEDGYLVFAGFLINLRPDQGRLDPRYLSYVLQSKVYWDWITSESMRSGQPGINAQQLSRFPIDLPDFDVQREVADKLADVDSLASSLERLIVKKRAIKQGMMQELLTGRTRLAGYAQTWSGRRLGEVLKFQAGFPFSSVYFDTAQSGLRLVRNRDLRADDALMYYTGPYSEEFLLSDRDVLIGMDGEFEPVIWGHGPALLNQRVGRLRVSKAADATFLAYALADPLKSLQVGTGATTVKHLSHRDVERIEMPLPPKDEQEAIARVLRDVDTEISALERRLEATRDIKQGMMQELLTGRTRLPVDEEVAV